MTTTDLDNDMLQTSHEDDDSFSGDQTPVLREDFYQQTHVIALVDGREIDPRTDNDVDTVLDGIVEDLNKNEEMSTSNARSDRMHSNDERFYTASDGTSKDQGKDKDISMILNGLEKCATNCKNINTDFKDIRKDFVTRKELSPFLTGAENDQGKDEEMCTVFNDAERFICSNEDVGAVVADVEAELVKDENDNDLETGKQTGQTAQPDCSFPEPLEEFRVSSIYLFTYYCFSFNTTAKLFFVCDLLQYVKIRHRLVEIYITLLFSQ